MSSRRETNDESNWDEAFRAAMKRETLEDVCAGILMVLMILAAILLPELW